MVHEGQAGSGLRGGAGDRGAIWSLEPPSAYPDDLGRGDPAAEMAGGDDFPFTVLHKKWQYYLFTMLKQRVGTRAIKAKIDALWRKYGQGLVAYLEEGKVP